MATATSPNPRWKRLIADSISKGIKDEKGILYFALSTITSGSSPAPHVRYVVHRGFVNEQRDSKSESGVTPYNPAFGSNCCLMTTTDVRSPKAEQIFGNIKANGGEGAGANAEIAWWHETSQLQFRISGSLHLLPRASHPQHFLFPFAKLSPPPASSESNSNKTFDWAEERIRIFNKLSPGLLASFARPVPGSTHPKAQNFAAFGEGDGAGEGDKGKDDTNSPWPLELPQPGSDDITAEQQKLLDESENNFGLLVFEPRRVDVVDLGRDQRSVFEISESGQDWTERRVVP